MCAFYDYDNGRVSLCIMCTLVGRYRYGVLDFLYAQTIPVYVVFIDSAASAQTFGRCSSEKGTNKKTGFDHRIRRVKAGGLYAMGQYF